jgi:hypothetical protein
MDEQKPNLDEHSTADLNLKEAKRVWSLAEADIIKSYLENNGILCAYRSLAALNVHVFTSDGMGEIKIMVKAEDLETAKELLENAERTPEEPA